jgi:hypothetical protein
MKILFTLVALHSILVLNAQDLLKFSVNIENDIPFPMSVSLDGINYNMDKNSLVLYELNQGSEKRISSQLESGHSALLWFILDGQKTANEVRHFVLRAETTTQNQETAIKLRKNLTDLNLSFNNKSILNYRFGLIYPPDSIVPWFSKNIHNLKKKGAYLHPVWSPGGEVLTQIQALDHPHHFGIWGPWTKTKIGERKLDFWDLSLGQGTVNFDGFLSQTEGNVFGGFKALQNHMDFGANGEDQIAFNEILDVRVWNIGEGIWMIDYTSSLSTSLETGVLFEKYRYGGGIGFRATEKWKASTSTIFTSGGKNRQNADATNARWCIVEGVSGVSEGRSGILFMSHPSNRSHPEPMRIWPSSMNDLYFQFSPIKQEAWKLEQNRSYTLKYRLIVFDGDIKPELAEKYWKSFAFRPFVKFEN